MQMQFENNPNDNSDEKAEIKTSPSKLGNGTTEKKHLRGGSSLSPMGRHKSPEPKILQAVDFFEAKCVVENPHALSVRFVKSNKVYKFKRILLKNIVFIDLKCFIFN